MPSIYAGQAAAAGIAVSLGCESSMVFDNENRKTAAYQDIPGIPCNLSWFMIWYVMIFLVGYKLDRHIDIGYPPMVSLEELSPVAGHIDTLAVRWGPTWSEMPSAAPF